MRKRIITPEPTGAEPSGSWLDLERIAEVELTSEDPDHPIEAALSEPAPGGWRATGPGPQTIRLVFLQPRDIDRIVLEFQGDGIERTQEFVLRGTAGTEEGARTTEIVRQQWNFSPGGSTSQAEDLTVELRAVSMLELVITPDIGGGDSVATLARLRVA